MNQTQFHYYWREPRVQRRFRTAVSLHSHTMHSQESLDFIPRMATTIPLVRAGVAAQERSYERRNGYPPDYANAYWTPPLSERQAVQLETRQIEDLLGMSALVSLTDHDNIEAANHLQLFEEFATAPISVEWTVPYGPTFFHLGIHNLPGGSARQWTIRLAAHTAAPVQAVLAELLVGLAEMPGVLVVFNHPLWDEKGLGGIRHRQAVHDFLTGYGPWLHAFELNGMRPWAENQEVIALARAFGQLVVAGGDRHGSEPNTVLNVTNTAGLEEFIDEVRHDRLSDVVILPHYRAPFRQRYAEAIWDVMRDYPEHTGRVRWTDRFFFRTADGLDRPLSSIWTGDGPGIIGNFSSLIRLMGSRHVRSTLRLAMRTSSEVLP